MMKYANNIQLQVSASEGVARMTFVQARQGIDMPELGIGENAVVSEIVADIVMPIRMAQEFSDMLLKALNPANPGPQVLKAS